MVGILALGTEAIGYYVNRLLALKYFPDQEQWDGLLLFIRHRSA